MKKTLLISIAISLSTLMVFAQPQTNKVIQPKQLTEAEKIMLKAKTGKPFDVRRNCIKGDNLFSYRGQELYVLSFEYISRHRQFKSPETTGENPDVYNISYYHDDTHSGGTDPKYVVGRTFIVDRIAQNTSDADEFVFEMHDKSTHERVSYEYSTATQYHRQPPNRGFVNHTDIGNPTFPFLVMSHYKYLRKKYIGKSIVVASHCYSEISDYEHDIYTREPSGKLTSVSVDGDYSTFKIKDIIWDEHYGFLCFVLDNNKGETYYTPIEATYNEPEYSFGIARKFLVSDWEKLVSMYGIDEMKNIMNGVIHVGMDSSLVKMSAGMPYVERFAQKSDGLEWLYNTKDVMVVFDDSGKVKELKEGVPQEEQLAKVGMLVIGGGMLRFGFFVRRVVSFPFRLIGRIGRFLGF